VKRIMAIDPSLTNTTVFHGTTADDAAVEFFASKPRGVNAVNRVRRYEDLLGRIQRLLEQVAPDLIFIEGYSYGSKTSGVTQALITEFGGLLRWHLVDQTPHVIEVPPSSLKQYVCAKGNAKKEQVMMDAALLWQRRFENNDEADAYVLYRMALATAGRGGLVTSKQKSVLKKVLSSHDMSFDQIKSIMGCDIPF